MYTLHCKHIFYMNAITLTYHFSHGGCICVDIVSCNAMCSTWFTILWTGSSIIRGFNKLYFYWLPIAFFTESERNQPFLYTAVQYCHIDVRQMCYPLSQRWNRQIGSFIATALVLHASSSSIDFYNLLYPCEISWTLIRAGKSLAPGLCAFEWMLAAPRGVSRETRRNESVFMLLMEILMYYQPSNKCN